MALQLPRKLDFDSLIFRSDFHKWGKVFRALLARLLLIGHCCLSVYLIAQIDTGFYGIYAPCIFCFILETGIILYFRWGCEWTRICTCFMCYLGTMVPVLWIMRLHEVNQDKGSSNSTQVNQTTLQETPKDIPIFEAFTDPKEANALADYFKQNKSSLIEQSMMILLILCRWLLPRGKIDRNSLTQLLIMYSAISADILDFSDIFEKEKIKKSGDFKYIILGVWSWSLVQFIPVITTSFHFRRHQLDANKLDEETNDNSEILSILMVLFMQDGPFLLVRCYSIFRLGVSDYLIVFFALKNLITVSLGCYRALVLCGCCSREGDDLLRKSEIARSIESLDMICTSSDTLGKHKRAKREHSKFSLTSECNGKKGKNSNKRVRY